MDTFLSFFLSFLVLVLLLSVCLFVSVCLSLVVCSFLRVFLFFVGFLFLSQFLSFFLSAPPPPSPPPPLFVIALNLPTKLLAGCVGALNFVCGFVRLVFMTPSLCLGVRVTRLV